MSVTDLSKGQPKFATPILISDKSSSGVSSFGAWVHPTHPPPTHTHTHTHTRYPDQGGPKLGWAVANFGAL